MLPAAPAVDAPLWSQIAPPTGELQYRAATPADAGSIYRLFLDVYGGKYPFPAVASEANLTAHIAARESHLWLVAVAPATGAVVAAMTFDVDHVQRLAKAGGAVVAKEFRRHNAASVLLNAGVRYLAHDERFVDALYGTTRVLSAGPSKLAANAGFITVGFMPNAIQIAVLEHLNLNVYLAPDAHAMRRVEPRLLPAVADLYEVIAARHRFRDKAQIVHAAAAARQACAPLTAEFDASVVAARYAARVATGSDAELTYDLPNLLLRSEDGSTEVFVQHGGAAKCATIVHIGAPPSMRAAAIDAAARALDLLGSAYVELQVSAYDPAAQAEALAGRLIPSGYFPAMRRLDCGRREDRIIFSRTFRVLDLNEALVAEDNLPFVRIYRRLYQAMYLDLRYAPRGREGGAP